MEDEVLAALRVLRRAGKIDSILFYESDGITVYLPSIDCIWLKEDDHYFYIYHGDNTEKSRIRLKKENHKELLQQWKLARLAVEFR